MRNIGDVIKILREERLLTQRDLAKKLKISPSTIGMWESGERIPNEEMKELLADYFNVDMNYLYGKTNIRNSYREGNGVNDASFNSAQDALKFILEQPIFASNVGYDPKKMTDEQLIKLANRILRFTKMEIEDMDYVDLDELDSLE
ncbi:MAG: helix-turn-helix domain-containing protein [Bacteroidales bacterium]